MPSYLNSVAIIDDDEIFQMLIRKVLEKKLPSGSILQFSNGHEAFLYFKNNLLSVHQLPQIIFLDVNMPVMNGWEFLKQLDKLQFNEPYEPSIFIISAIETINSGELTAYPCVKGYLTKPIVPADVINIVQSVIQSNEGQ